MRFVEAPEVEVLKDTTDATDAAKAARRKKLIFASAERQETHLFNENATRGDRKTGMPSKGTY